MGERVVKREVVHVGLSPMNPRVKYAQLACGHDVWGPRKQTVGKMIPCERCTKESPDA